MRARTRSAHDWRLRRSCASGYTQPIYVRRGETVTEVFNSLVSGHGSAPLSAPAKINYALVTVAARPYESSAPDVNADDFIIRCGWFAFGSEADGGDGVVRVYWRDPIWINFDDFEWSPVPQTWSTPEDFHMWASHVRWRIGAGGSVRLFVVAP